MKRRMLGRSGPEISAIGFGAMGFSQSYGHPKSKEEAIPVIRAAVEGGATLFDTAEVYGPLINEEILGEACNSDQCPRNIYFEPLESLAA